MNEDTNKELLERLNELESKMAALESKAELFSSEVKEMRGGFDEIKTLAGVPKAQPQTRQPAAPPQMRQPVAAPRAYTPQQRAQMQARISKAQKPRKQTGERSFEQFIGKNAMGIGATILVFIAMVMFATILMPYIGQELKCAAMYLFSFMLIGLGEYVYKKQKNGYLILTACGAGALYISLFATKIYFHFIDSLPLYALLLVWMGFVAYLGKKRHMLFVILGQIGIFVALVIASIGLITPADLYLSAAFLAISEALFFILFWKDEYKYNLINTIGLLLSLITFDIGAYDKILSVRYASSPGGLLLMVASIILMGFAVCRLIHISDSENKQIASGVIGLVNTPCVLAASIFFEASMTARGYFSSNPGMSILKDSAWCKGFVPLYLAAVLIMLIRRQKSEGDKRPALQYICMAMAVGSLTMLPSPVVPYLIAAVLMGLVIYNYKVNRKDLYYVSQAVIFFALLNMIFDENMYVVALLLVLSLIQMFYSRRKNPGVRMLKYEGISYVSTILLVMNLVEIVSNRIWIGSGFMQYFAMTGLFIVIQMAARETDWTDSDAPKIGIFHIANLLMMLFALSGFREERSTLELVCYAALMVGLFSINLSQLLEIKENFGAYIAGKYTVLAGAVLHAAGALGYIYSIVFLALAITCVIVGFKINNKSIRLYGLVLSMLSVFKLIMIDISYSNTLGRAFSFLLAGLICFGISMVYNHIEKQQKQKKEDLQ